MFMKRSSVQRLRHNDEKIKSFQHTNESILCNLLWCGEGRRFSIFIVSRSVWVKLCVAGVVRTNQTITNQTLSTVLHGSNITWVIQQCLK